MIGIYCITNNLNNKKYIGQSIDIERRWRDHKKSINYSITDNYPLYRAFRKYGLENFTFEVVEECQKNELNNKEIYYIKKFNSFVPNGYNATSGGNNSKPMKLSIEQVKEIKELLKNSTLSQFEISEQFNVSQRTISSINTGETWIDEETSYPLRKEYVLEHETKRQFYCIDCGKLISSGATRCANCFSVFNRKVGRPDRILLKKLIRNKPFTVIGKEFGVSDNAVRKWCDYYNLPKKKNEIKKYSDEEWKIL